MPFSSTEQDSFEKESILEILDTILKSSVLRIFYLSFTFHVPYLFYCVCFMWNIRSMRDLQWYVPRIRKYAGFLIGIFSVILSFHSIDVADRSYKMAYVLVSVSFLLNLVAAVVAYGLGGEPDLIVGVVSIIIGFGTCLPSIKTFVVPNMTRSMVMRNFVGIYHSLVGLVLITMSLRDQDEVERVPWSMRNGSVPQREN